MKGLRWKNLTPRIKFRMPLYKTSEPSLNGVMKRLIAILSLLFLFVANPSPMAAGPQDWIPGEAVTAGSNLFKPIEDLPGFGQELVALTYNVAGLPEPISQSSPEKNIPAIAKKLNAFPLVLLQEDFWYTEKLRAQAHHPYESPFTNTMTMGDGLSLLSQYPLIHYEKVVWKDCHGILSGACDCLASKGFSFSVEEMAPGVRIHVYNVHLDAGRAPEDRAARAKQVDQLLSFMEANSSYSAVIVGGDFNLKVDDAKVDDRGLLEKLLVKGNLKDACREVQCGQESLDRFLFRDGGNVDLKALSWEIADKFQDEQGQPLSDHLPVQVKFYYSSRSPQTALMSR